MKPKVIYATLAITVIFFLLGWLVYGILLVGFYKENTIQYAGLMKEEPAMWVYLVNNLFMAILIVYIFTLAGIKTFVRGMITGLILFFLVSFSFDIVIYGTMNLYKGISFFMDLFVSTLIGGLLGGLAGLFLGLGKK